MKIPLSVLSEAQNDKFDFREIRTFEDACEKLNLDPNNLPRLGEIPKRMKKPLIALYKLMIITEAINDKWIPDMVNKNQMKFLSLFDADESGSGFSSCKHSATNQQLKTSSFLYCESQIKETYISTQFEDLFKDLLLICRSFEPETEDKHKYGRQCFNFHGYRH